MTKKLLLFSRLTGSGAPQRRVDNLIRLFTSCNYKSYLVRFDTEKKNTVTEINDSLEHISLGDIHKMRFFSKIISLNYSSHFAKKWIDTVKPDLVVIYSTINYTTALFIKIYCKKLNIPLVFDVVEYRLLTSSLSLRKFLSYNLHNYITNNIIIQKTDNVIVISNFIKKFFLEKGAKNLFHYPITFVVSELPKYDKRDYLDKVTFLYAGSPGGKKDLINEILVSFSILDEYEKNRIMLFICGIDFNELIKEGVSRKTLSEISSFTRFQGKLIKDDLYALMKNIDYTLLLKNEKNVFSSAGFPTKMAESFAFGIPMLANYSGDISLYLQNEYNGLVSPSHNPNDFVQTIRKGISYAECRKHQLLASNALSTAFEKLNTDSFIESFSSFLDQIYLGRKV